MLLVRVPFLVKKAVRSKVAVKAASAAKNGISGIEGDAPLWLRQRGRAL